MNSTEIPFVNYVFITITAGVLAFVTLMDEGTVVNDDATVVPVDTQTDIFSSVSANSENQSALNSLPSIFSSSKDIETVIPEPEPLNLEGPDPLNQESPEALEEPIRQDGIVSDSPNPIQQDMPVSNEEQEINAPSSDVEPAGTENSQENRQAYGGNKTKGNRTNKQKKKRTIKRK